MQSLCLYFLPDTIRIWSKAVPLDEMQEWIDDALDLIEFANGTADTKWGKIRCDMGHAEPFNLEYLAVGNEEVGQGFWDR